MELHRAQPVALLCRALAMRTEEHLSAVSRGQERIIMSCHPHRHGIKRWLVRLANLRPAAD